MPPGGRLYAGCCVGITILVVFCALWLIFEEIELEVFCGREGIDFWRGRCLSRRDPASCECFLRSIARAGRDTPPISYPASGSEL